MKTKEEAAAVLKEVASTLTGNPPKTSADWDAVAQNLRACLSFATKAKATLARAESL